MRISLIGAGRVAHHLAHVLNAQHQIVQIYSRSLDRAQHLAAQVGAEAIAEVEKLHSDSDYSLNYNDYKHLIKENFIRVTSYNSSISNYTDAYPYKKNEFSRSTSEDLEYYSSYHSKNTYNDYDYYDELYSSKYVDNIDPFLKGTIFEKEPEELSLFSFDFRKIFSKSALQSNCYSDIHNLYASMTNLLVDTFPDELELDSLQRAANEAITDSLSLINLGNDTDDNVD